MSALFLGPASALTLKEPVGEALKSNPEILSSAENREAVEFELRQARGLYLPTLDLEASAGGRRFGTQDDGLDSADVGLIFTQTLLDGDARRDEVEHAIRTGMIASVEILTGEKTVLDYLLKANSKARYEALTER